mmetsp:Transcript_25774/g.56852  ORF Transcript_25774/g.56852 Transcript_25774/m.56852 type:complete len:200 (+) Transcript_25774:1435-2034(+)
MLLVRSCLRSLSHNRLLRSSEPIILLRICLRLNQSHQRCFVLNSKNGCVQQHCKCVRHLLHCCGIRLQESLLAILSKDGNGSLKAVDALDKLAVALHKVLVLVLSHTSCLFQIVLVLGDCFNQIFNARPSGLDIGTILFDLRFQCGGALSSVLQLPLVVLCGVLAPLHVLRVLNRLFFPIPCDLSRQVVQELQDFANRI